MAAKCEVCGHPQRDAIEKALRLGGRLKFIGSRYTLQDDQLAWHRDYHMSMVPAVIPSIEVIQTKMDPSVVFMEHDECIMECKRLIEYSQGERDAEGVWTRAPDIKGWALGTREWRGCLDQKNRMLGLYDRLDPRLQRTFAGRVIQVVSRALEKYPEAKNRVLEAINEIEKDGG